MSTYGRMKNGLLVLVLSGLALWGIAQAQEPAAAPTPAPGAPKTEATVEHAGGGEANIRLPALDTVRFEVGGVAVSGLGLMHAGLAICAISALFGLVAFGFLDMGPATIAVDSFGPVTDNAQSVYELSQIESDSNVKEEIRSEFGFEPDFENAKHLLESNDGAGNTFKATAKPVLIGIPRRRGDRVRDNKRPCPGW